MERLVTRLSLETITLSQQLLIISSTDILQPYPFAWIRQLSSVDPDYFEMKKQLEAMVL